MKVLPYVSRYAGSAYGRGVERPADIRRAVRPANCWREVRGTVHDQWPVLFEGDGTRSPSTPAGVAVDRGSPGGERREAPSCERATAGDERSAHTPKGGCSTFRVKVVSR